MSEREAPSHCLSLVPSATTDRLVEGAIKGGTATVLICRLGRCSRFKLPECISLGIGFGRRWRRRMKGVMAAVDQGKEGGTFVVLT